MQLAELDPPRKAATSRGAHARTRSWSISERAGSVGVIVLLVLVANSLYILHVFNPNPINEVSGVGIVHAGPLPGGNNIDPNIGFTAQALGHRAAVDWLHGHVPWWDPYEGVGAPLAGEMQSAALFPPNALNLLPDGQVYFRIALEITAGISTYLLLRRFTRSNVPAVVGGIAFALNGTFSWLFHAPGNPIAFLPLLLLGFEWARESAVDGTGRRWVLIAVALALSIYAGFPEVAFIDGLLAVVWILVRSVGLPRPTLVKVGQSVLFGAGIGVLLAAPILVAFLDYLPNANVGPHGGALAHTSLSPVTGLPVQVMPYLFGPIFGFSGNDPGQLNGFWGSIGGYLGASLCVLALIGLFGRRYRLLRVVLALWVVIGLARTVGAPWALDLVNIVPGVSHTAFYRYAPVSFEFAVVVLAVLTLDDLFERSISWRRILAGGVVMVVALALAWHEAGAVFARLHGVPHYRQWAGYSLAWALLTVVAIVAVALLPRSGPGGRQLDGLRRLTLAAIVVIDLLAMFVVPQFSAPRQATIDMKPVSFLQQHLGESRYFTLGPLAPDYGSYWGISSVNVNDLPIPKLYGDYIAQHLNTNVNPMVFVGDVSTDPDGPNSAEELVTHLASYEAAGVKYVVIPTGYVLPGAGASLHQVFHDSLVTIVELPHPSALFAASGCSVRTTSTTSATIACHQPVTLVYRELTMPGWHATVNGQPVAIRRQGQIFQSVSLPAGTSAVVFWFSPPHLLLAVLAFALGCLCLLAAAHPERALRRRRGAGTHRTGSAVRPQEPANPPPAPQD